MHHAFTVFISVIIAHTRIPPPTFSNRILTIIEDGFVFLNSLLFSTQKYNFIINYSMICVNFKTVGREKLFKITAQLWYRLFQSAPGCG